jgi:glutamyl-Q tRNA(Asp) synthetase
MVCAAVSEITRFAPSPTGLLHLGHALAAIAAHDAAHSGLEGRFLLRIEDLDQERSRPEFADRICDDLAWLGLKWQPPLLIQSSRKAAYREALATLEQLGVTYPCFCTRREISDEIARAAEAPHAPSANHGTALYPGTCRTLSSAVRERRIRTGQHYAMRLNSMQAAARCAGLTFTELGGGPNGELGSIQVDPRLFGDIVLGRKHAPAAYHLAVVVDDAFQGISLVTRGNDLFSATHVQRVLQHLLNLPVPRYSHHRLILDAAGKKLSKRDRAVTLCGLRDAGVTADEVRARLLSVQC